MLQLMHMIKVVIFDFDGVLYDTNRVVQNEIRRMYPHITDEMLDQLCYGNFHEKMAKIAHLRIEETEAEKEKRRKNYSEAKLLAPLFVGMQPLLQELKNAGYKLAINTSAYRNNCIPLLEKSGIESLFDYLGTCEVSISKVEKFSIIAETFQVKNDQMIFLTDTVGDIRDAEEAKVKTIAVTWGFQKRKHFENESFSNLMGIVDSPSEVFRLIHV